MRPSQWPCGVYNLALFIPLCQVHVCGCGCPLRGPVQVHDGQLLLLCPHPHENHHVQVDLVRPPAYMSLSCLRMVEFAKACFTNSMQLWFEGRLGSTEAMASSVNYFLSFVSSSSNVGRLGCNVCVLVHVRARAVCVVYSLSKTPRLWTLCYCRRPHLIG